MCPLPFGAAGLGSGHGPQPFAVGLGRQTRAKRAIRHAGVKRTLAPGGSPPPVRHGEGERRSTCAIADGTLDEVDGGWAPGMDGSQLARALDSEHAPNRTGGRWLVHPAVECGQPGAHAFQVAQPIPQRRQGGGLLHHQACVRGPCACSLALLPRILVSASPKALKAWGNTLGDCISEALGQGYGRQSPIGCVREPSAVGVPARAVRVRIQRCKQLP